jgi:cell division transport system permease protein
VALLRLAGLAVALIVSFACLYIVASTIRLGVHARREQIEILKLVGATDRFVRVPFLIEGTLQGVVGAVAAGCLLFAIFRFAAPRLEGALSAALSHVQLGFLSPAQLALGLLAGALLGLFGSRLALGRYGDV